MTTAEQTGTAAPVADAKPKDLSLLTVAELEALIKSRDEKHRNSQKHLKALARAKTAISDE